MSTAGTSLLLFKLLPGELFRPLASPNREHHWILLCRLFDEFFGPDAPMPPSVGLPRREITAAIERYLLADDLWEAEEGDIPDAPLPARAQTLYERLRGAGWLRQERVGAREMVSMPPLVAQFLSTLIDFSEHGPTFVSAKVRSIELQLHQVVEGRAGADALDEAADQARKLLVSLSSMSLQVRDLMPELSKAETTAQFARQWFERYVGQFFIGDYADLHRADHPLARRSSILAMVRQIESTELGERLQAWYVEHLSGHDPERASHRLQRSLRRLHELDRIDEYLGRLDDDIRQANRRALAFIDYRLRAPDKLDLLLQRACQGALSAPGQALRMPVGPGGLMRAERLRAPRQKPQPIARSANSSQQPTSEQLARLNLLRRIKRARLVTAEDMARYLGPYLERQPKVDSADLSIDSIEEFRAYQTLLTLALRSHRHGGLRRDDPLGRLLRGFRVELVEGAGQLETTYLRVSLFVIHRIQKAV
ncbi:Wadjet anti-phage system protein JetA family protein [Xanthomonas campestris]|uniref:Wadjet anti-phage system protein JetA family protein n=1 Tax=Xanthomonas campestris TaxID=339 RepID=UPI001EE120ED|nr:Wadjet anti-phage system protein JetA family protein [Xanthomonas campestris]